MFNVNTTTLLVLSSITYCAAVWELKDYLQGTTIMVYRDCSRQECLAMYNKQSLIPIVISDNDVVNGYAFSLNALQLRLKQKGLDYRKVYYELLYAFPGSDKAKRIAIAPIEETMVLFGSETDPKLRGTDMLRFHLEKEDLLFTCFHAEGKVKFPTLKKASYAALVAKDDMERRMGWDITMDYKINPQNSSLAEYDLEYHGQALGRGQTILDAVAVFILKPVGLPESGAAVE